MLHLKRKRREKLKEKSLGDGNITEIWKTQEVRRGEEWIRKGGAPKDTAQCCKTWCTKRSQTRRGVRSTECPRQAQGGWEKHLGSDGRLWRPKCISWKLTAVS